MIDKSDTKGATARGRKTFVATALASVAASALLSSTAFAESPNVVTTIKPIHSIAAAVMDGVGTPHILIDGAASPHGFALKPSQASLLEGADVVFWVGPQLTPSLEKPISSMASDAEVLSFMDVKGVSHLGIREGKDFDSHDHDHGHDHGAEEASHEEHEEEHHDEHAHDDHDHDNHEEHAHAEDEHKHGDSHDEHAHDDHDKEKHGDHEEHAHAEEEHDHDEGHADHDDHDHDKHEEHAGHDHSDHAGDPHIWLNPDNGIAIAGAMAEKLAEVDPTNAEKYRENATAFQAKIEALEGKIEEQLHPVEGKKFIVFHDAYHHFEHHFDIEASGSITISPEALSSADRVADIQGRIRDLEVTCVFQEPQFDAKLVDVVMEGSSAQKGTLDPLGTDLENGPDLYPNLLQSLANSLSDCLKG